MVSIKYRNIQVYINLFSVRSSNKSRTHRLETRTSKKAEKKQNTKQEYRMYLGKPENVLEI